MDPLLNKNSPNWPPRPESAKPVNQVTRQKLFGSFSYRPAPEPKNPEAVKILGNWVAKNIVTVEIPQLVGVQGAPKDGRVQFHRNGADKLVSIFQVWEDADLLHLIKSWGGSWAPRFIRGSRVYLSNHCFGSAFDINVAWNGLGVKPPLVGEIGSVRELVPYAVERGWVWGAWFTKPDGMHFELAEV